MAVILRMNISSLLGKSNVLRHWLIILTLLVALSTGASTLIWKSPLAPLLVVAVIGFVVISVLLLEKPVRALYVTIFLTFLPQGLLPDTMPGVPFVFLLLTLLFWLLAVGFQYRQITWTSTCLLVIGYLLWGCITIFWAPDLLAVRRELVQNMIVFLLLFLTINLVNSLETLDGLMRTLSLVGWVLVLLGVGTVLFTDYQYGTRLSVFSMNENLFGVVLIFTLPGVLWGVIRSSGRLKIMKMFLSFIFIMLALLLIAFSGSRGSSLSFVLTLLTFLFWKSTRRWGIVGLSIVVVALIAAPMALLSVTSRFVTPEDVALGGRPVIWRASLALISDHPLSGVGIGNGPASLHDYIDTLTDEYAKRDDLPSHNPFLEVGADTGIFGMLIYLSIFISALWLFIRKYIQLSRVHIHNFYPYYALVACMFVGYMSSWIKGGGLHAHPTYFLLLALLVLPSRLDIGGKESTINVQNMELSHEGCTSGIAA
jgi:O-antigen ligase